MRGRLFLFFLVLRYYEKKNVSESPHFFSHLYRKRTGNNSSFQSQKMESGDDYLSLVGLLPVNPGWKKFSVDQPMEQTEQKSPCFCDAAH